VRSFEYFAEGKELREMKLLIPMIQVNRKPYIRFVVLPLHEIQIMKGGRFDEMDFPLKVRII
jgi:hypothetical protein